MSSSSWSCASFDGIIESRNIELGEAVGLGFTLFSLVSDTMFEIEVDVPANRARVLNPYEEIIAETSDNIKFSATIRSIGIRENSSTRTLQVRLSFDASSISRSINVGESLPAGTTFMSISTFACNAKQASSVYVLLLS